MAFNFTLQINTENPDDIRVLTHLAEIADFDSGINVDRELLSSLVYFIETFKNKVVDKSSIGQTARLMFEVDGSLSQKKWNSFFELVDEIKSHYLQAVDYAREHTRYFE